MGRFFLLVITAFVAVIAFANIHAIVRGRCGATFAHKLMIASGITGLFSLLVMAASAYFLGAMLIVATLRSTQGFAFIVSAGICALSSLASSLLCMVCGQWGTRHT